MPAAFRTCTSCHLQKAASLEFFSKNSRSPDGLNWRCKVCASEAWKTYYDRNRKELVQKATDRTAASRKASPENAERARVWAREWKRRAHSDPEKYAAHLKAGRRWCAENPEAVKNFRCKQPDYRAQATAKRKAAKLQATPAWANQADIAAVYAEARRLTEETGVLHHVDHIIPLCGRNVCGLHVALNLRPIPAAENIKKNRFFSEEILNLI